MWLFYFQYGFRSSLSTADLLGVVPDRIARAFKVAHMVEIASFDLPKKELHLFSGNSAFVLKCSV